MQIEFLAAQGFSRATIDNWKTNGRTALLPLQAEAVARTRLLSGGNVVVFAPTSSGKTFVAELAAARHLERGRKSVFLVPTKALAEEQYRHLEEAYSEVGARVVIATRERTRDDARILRGDFDFAVMVYEKLKAFLTIAPELLARISLVAVDELQILGEAGRGDLVDLLLTQIVQARQPVQVVCLSAVLGENLRLASWLNAEPLIWAERPTELREGIFCLEDAHFYYCERNTGTEATEALLQDDDAPEAGCSVVTDAGSCQYPAAEVLACTFVERDEQVLIFVPTREMSRQWAYRLANALPGAYGREPGSRLTDAEESHSRELMERCMQAGVAFHNADLGAELRRIVEERFAAGEVRVLIATSTLAQGVNLNCRNVISVPLMLDPGATAASARPAFVPLSVQKFRNQGGRAGRLCSGEPFGRSILIAEDHAELRRMMNQYVRAEVEPLEPRVCESTLERLCLDLVHTGRAADVEMICAALMHTYSAATYWASKPAELRRAVTQCVERLQHARLLQASHPSRRIHVTGLGQVAAAYGLQAATVQLFADYATSTRACTELELLALCAFCADGELFPVSVSQREAAEQVFPRLLRMRHGSLVYALPEQLRTVLAPDGGFSNAGMCALKKMFLADAWISSTPTCEIEEQYRVFAGTFANLGAHFSWLAQALSACMATLGCEEADVHQVHEFAERMAWGCSATGLDIARLGIPGIARTHVQQLLRAGYDRLDAFVGCDAGQLGDLLPLRSARRLIAEAQRISTTRERSSEHSWFSILEQWNLAKQHQAAKETSGTATGPPAPAHSADNSAHVPLAAESASHYVVEIPELVLDPKSPGEIQVRGLQVMLTPKPFELLCLLARSAGTIVSYADIDAALWPDCKVESQQRSAHKVRLVSALAHVIGKDAAGQVVENIPRFGMRLNLPEDKIRFGRLRTPRSRTEPGGAYASAS
jgi:helicase